MEAERKIRASVLPLALGLFALLGLDGLFAQDEAPAPGGRAPTFFEAIDVNIVNVDVVVTDKQGRLVTGLTRDDFELYEDGEPVGISNFDAVYGPAGSGAAGGETATRPEEEPEASFAPLRLVLFVDNFHLSPGHRKRVLNPVRDFIETGIRSEDQVMVLSFDGALEIRQQLTGSVPAVLDALEEVGKSSSRGAAAAAERRSIEREIRDLVEENAALTVGATDPGEEGDLDGLTSDLGTGANLGVEAAVRVAFYRVREFADSRQRDATASLAALRETVALLSALPGRKALLYIGGDMSTRPGWKLYEEWTNTAARAGVSPEDVSLSSTFTLDINDQLRDLAELANAHRVTVYGAGVVVEDSVAGMAAENRSGLLGSVRSGGESLSLAQREAPNQANALAMMAEPTGGFSITGNFGRLLDRVQTDFSGYYSLAYKPARPRDTEIHQIRVKVSRPGLRLRYREQFREKTAEQRMADHTKSALLLANPGNPLEAALDVAPGEALEDNFERVRLTVKIPMARLTLLPRENFHEGRLRIFVSTRDARGRVSTMENRPVPIRIPNENLLAALGQIGTFPLNLRMRRGEHTIAVGIRDELGHVESIVRVRYPTETTGTDESP